MLKSKECFHFIKKIVKNVDNFVDFSKDNLFFYDNLVLVY